MQFQSGDVIEHSGRRYFLGVEIRRRPASVVFECSDQWGNPLVAKIVLPRGRNYQEVRQEWLAEAANLFALRHPNVTYLYDAFEHQGQFLLIVERCSCTLRHLIKTVGIKGDLWLPCVAHGLLGAINFIHQRGYVHKDLHPNNVFGLMKSRIDPDSPGAMIKVGDLGRCMKERDIRASEPTMMNRWMFPPEGLAPAEFGALAKQVDIFHAGALLLALLLGRIPQFTDEEILAGKPREVALSVNSPFACAIANALHNRVDLRTQSAAQFWQDLSQTGCLQSDPRLFLTAKT